MSTTTQQILCCVGATVAGRPTQFIMERAFATVGHDWRVLTVEVPSEKFDTALHGMAAMGFRALRIYPSLSAQAAQLLCSADCKSSFVANATSAELIDGRWKCWDHSGFGLLELLNARLDWSKLLVFLDGDDIMHRSLLAAMVESQRWPKQMIWSRPSANLPEWLVACPDTSDEPTIQGHTAVVSSAQAIRRINAQPEDDEGRSILEALNAEELFAADQDEPRYTSLLHLSNGPSTLQSLPLQELSQRGVTKLFVLNTDGQGVLKEYATISDIPVVPISQVEVLIECEAYDFRRWTGQSIDRGLIQEAYDEFSDF